MTLYRVTDRAGAQYEVDTLCEQGDLMPVEDAMSRAEWEATKPVYGEASEGEYLRGLLFGAVGEETSEPSEQNPYSGDQPSEHAAWEEGFSAAVGEETDDDATR